MTTQEQYNMDINDEELDLLLAEWAETEIDVPEGFHASVMNRLRAEVQPLQAPQKKGIVVSLAERFANKKAWVSTIAAAALILCCLPILQERQVNLAVVENSEAQIYEMKSRIAEDKDGMSEDSVMMNTTLADAQTSSATTGTVNAVAKINGAMDSTEKLASPPQDSYSYTIDESRADLTQEEQLKLLQDNLAEVEAHLAALDDSTETDELREELQNKIDELKAEIKALEEQINTAE